VSIARRVGLPRVSRRPGVPVGQELLRVATSTLFLGFVVAWLSWPLDHLSPRPGLDTSWNAAVYLALSDGLHFGRDLIFTYGPLGFLALPELYSPWPVAIAAVYVAITHTAVCTILVWAARRTFGVVPAVLIAYVAAKTIPLPTSRFLVVAVFIVCVSALLTAGNIRLNRLLAAAGGALAGVELLVRLDIGLSMLVLLAVTILLIPAQRYLNLAVLGGSCLTAFLIGWVSAGQSFSTLGAFLEHSLEIAAGYGEAMAIDDPSRAWEYSAALLVVAVAATAAAGAVRARPLGTQIRVAVVGALFVFLSFKHGFVRHDALHSTGFFAAMFGGLLAFTWPPERRREPLLALGTALVAFLAAGNFEWRQFDPVRSASRAVDHVETIVGDRSGAVDRSRIELRAWYRLDPNTLDALDGRTVAIWPWEAGVAWAYRNFEWRPIPVFQSYSAYTPELDALNRDFLASERAPERILRHQTSAIDDRLLQLDSPAATLEMLCRYVEISAGPGLQVLARTKNRCGAPERIATVPTRSGQPVAVPAGDPTRDVVFARVHGAGPTRYEKLRTLVFKLGTRRIILNGASSYRLVPGTADGPLLMRVPRSADFRAPFRLSPQAGIVAVQTGDDRTLTIELFRMPIQGPGIRHAPDG
jgi:hypothetical protein